MNQKELFNKIDKALLASLEYSAMLEEMKEAYFKKFGKYPNEVFEGEGVNIKSPQTKESSYYVKQNR